MPVWTPDGSQILGTLASYEGGASNLIDDRVLIVDLGSATSGANSSSLPNITWRVVPANRVGTGSYQRLAP